MKREGENFAGLGLKRSRFFNGIDENCGEDKCYIENEMTGIVEMDKNEFLIDKVSCGFELNASLDSVNEANKPDLDINSGLVSGNQTRENLQNFDLNVPAFEMEDSGIVQGFQESHVINEKRVEVIDLTLDDSDSDAQIIAYNEGDRGKGKQREVGMSGDISDEGNLASGCKSRYSREEKGKGKVVDSWFSIDNAIDLDSRPVNQDSSEVVEPRVDILRLGSGKMELGMWQPVVLDARSERAGQESRQREDTVAYGNMELGTLQPVVLDARPERTGQAPRERKDAVAYSEVLRATVPEFARIHYLGEENGNKSSGLEQKSPTLEADENLGNSPCPFTDEVEMVRAQNKRQGAQQLIKWKPLEENCDHRAPLVPSLMDLSLQALAENAEGIVSLELVPDMLNIRLTNLLCDMRKMDAHMLNLLVKGCPTVIRVKNCSWLTENQFRQMFWNCETKSLRVLQLDLCGQCMLDNAFTDALARPINSLLNLAIVSLRGACHLSDSGLKALVMSAPALLSINLGQCTLLTCAAISFIANSLRLILRELYIDDCPKLDAMHILPALKKFEHLEVLSVAGISTVSDQFIGEVILVCGQGIKELDLANCLKLTDHSLKIIGSTCTDLCSLNISNLHNLTDLGIEYLGNGCRSIQKLKLCHNGFSDEAMAAFLETSGGSLMELLVNNVRKVGPNTAFSLAKCSRQLLTLDISWCRQITNEALRLIVDGCSSLKLVKIFGCTQISDEFLNGHSNPLVRIIGFNLTPILGSLILGSLSVNEAKDVFLRYSPLPVSSEY
ncbi:uncharacterized protein Fot_14385 [Forsythia ovata]|uniref:Uncharacterized protein n=1 Tax=Forsythia ovata TaxID=205694 RepID=A0ABD1W6G2_9LAMI